MFGMGYPSLRLFILFLLKKKENQKENSAQNSVLLPASPRSEHNFRRQGKGFPDIIVGRQQKAQPGQQPAELFRGAR